MGKVMIWLPKTSKQVEKARTCGVYQGKHKTRTSGLLIFGVNGLSIG